MWNRENAAKLIGIVTKEYGREIIAEGSKSVQGLEDHLDKLVAKILGIESDIITATREWRKVIERAAITEGIDKVQLLLECRDMTITYKISNIEEQEIKIANKIIEEQREPNKVENITEEAETTVEEMHDIENKELKEEMRLIEGIKETQEEDLEILNINKQSINAQEIEEKEMITEEIESSLSKSI